MKYHDRAFFQLFGDSIWHADQALINGSEISKIASEKLTRASIITSAIALECASNCTTNLLSLSKRLNASVDKMTPLDKFEIAAKFHEKKFDGGDSRVASMRELIKLRNNYSHPKVKNIPIELDSMDETETNHVVNLSLTGERLENLGLDIISKFWFPEDAINVIKKCTEFYNWFFIECLELSKKEVFRVLAPLLFLSDDSPDAMVFHQACTSDELEILEKLGIENRFLDLNEFKTA